MNKLNADQPYDAAIIGGGSAGLSAATILARARRSVIVIDSGEPRNAPAAASHGLLGLDGVNPLSLLETGRREVAHYGAHIKYARVSHASGSLETQFALHLDDDSLISAKQLLIATGVRDDLPALPGLAARWGRDVVHCPYCQGWEIQGQRIGVLATGPMSAMQALLFQQWSEQMWFFPNGIDFPAEHLEKLRAVGIETVPGPVSEITVMDDRLTGVCLGGDVQIRLDALAFPALTHPRLEGLEGLNVEVTENAAGTAVVVDAAGHTSIPGIWAVGNAVNSGMQISEAAASGARAAMTLNAELVFAHAEHALSISSNSSDSTAR